ncbi:hypothetical protein [Nocardia sp. NPDC051981]|uniref:hypothetical protein n=1 Tax=Nocardia sp. NPDC051981 TaxID=3155417 RepID=UPI003417DC88
MTASAMTTLDNAHVCTIGGEIDALTAPTFQRCVVLSGRVDRPADSSDPPGSSSNRTVAAAADASHVG